MSADYLVLSANNTLDLVNWITFNHGLRIHSCELSDFSINEWRKAFARDRLCYKLTGTSGNTTLSENRSQIPSITCIRAVTTVWYH